MAKKQSVYPGAIDDLTVDRQTGQVITSDSYDVIEDAIYSIEKLVGVSATSAASTVYGVARSHAARHQNDGADEISVAGLSGELADPQPPKDHHTEHESGGGDVIYVQGLLGQLATLQKPSLNQGLDASRPSPGNSGALYWATDTKILYRDNITSWVEILRGEGVTRLLELAEKAHVSLTGLGNDDHTQYAKTTGRVNEDLTCQQDVNVDRDLYVNADYTAGDEDAWIYFNNDVTKYLKYDYGFNRFIFSKDLTADGVALGAHDMEHQKGGGDEIVVTGLSGKLADEQNAGWIKGASVVTPTDDDDTQVATYSKATSAISWEPGGTGSGTAMTKEIFQSNHGLWVSAIVRCSAASTYVLAQADTEEHAEVAGVVSAVADASTFTLLMGGYFGNATGLSPGSVYFLHPTSPGSSTTTEPASIGQISKPIGIAVSSTEVVIVNMRGMVVSTSLGPVELAVMKTGTYIGDGAADRAITGIGFQPKAVWIWENVSTNSEMDRHLKIDRFVGTRSATLWSSYYEYAQADRLKSLDADGFTIGDLGTDSHPNKNGIIYAYLAFGVTTVAVPTPPTLEYVSALKTGTYTGDGSTGNVISGLGFTPAFVRIWRYYLVDSGNYRIHESANSMGAGMAVQIYINDTNTRDNRITLHSDGFTVSDDGTDSDPNTSGQAYCYLALGEKLIGTAPPDVGEGKQSFFPWMNVTKSGSFALTMNANHIFSCYYQQTTPADGDYLTFQTFLSAGTYTIKYLSMEWTDRGKVDIQVNGVVMATFDCYGSSSEQKVYDDTGNVILTPGQKTIKVIINGKNPSSTSYRMDMKLLEFFRTA